MENNSFKNNILKEINKKKEKIQDYLQQKDYDGVIIGRRDNFSWFTCGGDNKVLNFAEYGFSVLLVYKDKIQLISQIMDGQRVIDEELQGLEVEYIPLKWYEKTRKKMLSDLIEDKRVLSDIPIKGAIYYPQALYSLHYPLNDLEIERLRWLGEKSEEVIRYVADNINPGMKEIEVAGMFLGEYGKLGIECEVLLIGSDERISKYRHPIPTEKKIEKFVLLHPAVKKWGLHANVTRMVSFGPQPSDIKNRFEATCKIAATAIGMCRPGERFCNILEEQKRLYKQLGYEEDWDRHFHGGITGYLLADSIICTDPKAMVKLKQPCDWFITITGVKVEELSLNTGDGIEICSVKGNWPAKEYGYNGQVLTMPQILYK